MNLIRLVYYRSQTEGGNFVQKIYCELSVPSGALFQYNKEVK